MKKIAIVLCTAWTVLQAGAAELQWLTNLPEALTKAKTENRLVMMAFTGSDWCPWCIKLDKEIFSQPEFAEYAQKHLVLVQVDFPRHKEQTPELKKANKELKAKYKVKFPKVVMLDGDGKELGRFGYQEGGPKPFIDQLAKLNKT